MSPEERARKARDLNVDRARTEDRLARAIEVHDFTAQTVARSRLERLNGELEALSGQPETVAS